MRSAIIDSNKWANKLPRAAVIIRAEVPCLNMHRKYTTETCEKGGKIIGNILARKNKNGGIFFLLEFGFFRFIPPNEVISIYLRVVLGRLP